MLMQSQGQSSDRAVLSYFVSFVRILFSHPLVHLLTWSVFKPLCSILCVGPGGGEGDIKILLYTYSFGSHCRPTWCLLFKFIAVRKSGDFTQKSIFGASLKKSENKITDLQMW